MYSVSRHAPHATSSTLRVVSRARPTRDSDLLSYLQDAPLCGGAQVVDEHDAVDGADGETLCPLVEGHHRVSLDQLSQGRGTRSQAALTQAGHLVRVRVS